ncbi:MAG: 16S rRNA processing protein RimM [Hirschia sp.]|nr:16S rRNA processing protein RimM [Hirschia sp.]MBF18614.1 16S rRNA processing protein RimM [Hirschia sp.]|tara:strand:- start:899 stop:1462 length:564 start_codon:yes stop_codon:yes gene_type:complete
MADVTDLVVIAQIAGAHGVRGDMKVRSYTDQVEDCFSYGPLLSAEGEVLVTPEHVRWQKDALFIVEPQEDRTREEWEALKGTNLHVPRQNLPEPDEDEFYIEDLIGCTIVHADGRMLGEVRHVHNFGSDDLLDIEAPNGEGWMLAFTRENVPEIDMTARHLVCDADEALLPDSLQRETDAGEESGES